MSDSGRKSVALVVKVVVVYMRLLLRVDNSGMIWDVVVCIGQRPVRCRSRCFTIHASVLLMGAWVSECSSHGMLRHVLFNDNVETLSPPKM